MAAARSRRQAISSRRPRYITSLPIIAFPAITISTASAQSAGGLWSRLSALVGAERTASESVQIRVPEAETYGLNSAEAEQLLEDFCGAQKPVHNRICTEPYARDALASVVDPSLLYPPDAGKGAKPSAPRHQIALHFIRRIYLTRSLEYVYGADTLVAATARKAATREPVAADPATAPAGQDARAKMEAASANLSRDLGALGQGGEVSVSAVTSNGAVLKMLFARPVVIGYEDIETGAFPANVAEIPAPSSQSVLRREHQIGDATWSWRFWRHLPAWSSPDPAPSGVTDRVP